MMGTLPILPKRGGSVDWCGIYLDGRRLPDFYMADFSVMGLRVADIGDTAERLQSGGIRVRFNMGLAVAEIGDMDAMKRLLGILDAHGIDYEWSDIAQQIYQG